MASYEDDLATALRLADQADGMALARFRAMDLRVTTKPDLTPVSDADTAVETALRATLASVLPDDQVLGEEFGLTDGNGDTSRGSRVGHDSAGSGSDRGEQRRDAGSGRRWVIDPIDGTKNFVRGVPVWATLIALVEDGTPVVGVVSAPALGRRWWAAAGLGAWATFGYQPTGTAPTRLSVSGVSELADASLCYSSIGGWESLGRLDAVLQLMRDTWRQRAFGDFFGYMLLAEGALDIMMEPELSLWDVAALVPIVTEAGGTFTDVTGRPGAGGQGAVATNGALHDRVITRLDLPTVIPG